MIYILIFIQHTLLNTGRYRTRLLTLKWVFAVFLLQ